MYSDHHVRQLRAVKRYNRITKIVLKVTVQFKTEGNGQNEIFSHMDRSEVSFKIANKKL